MLYACCKPLLFALPPEQAHAWTLKFLDYCPSAWLPTLKKSPCQVMGLSFDNPIGVAAGLDKDAEHINGLGKFGFGFIEVGTVTPKPQTGNAHPRLFRLNQADALINRMGFNNQGIESMVQRLQQHQYKGIVGVNLGKNRDTPLADAAQDYEIGMRQVYPYADYITINISSPNTKGLRDLQSPDALPHLLGKLKTLQKELARTHQQYIPLAIKIAPDLEAQELDAMATQFIAHDIDAVIATNTTTSRLGVKHFQHGNEQGGLSGKPLLNIANETITTLAQSLSGRIPIIGVGGIMSAQDVQDKLQAGAVLVQLYTGLVYRGSDLIGELRDI